MFKTLDRSITAGAVPRRGPRCLWPRLRLRTLGPPSHSTTVCGRVRPPPNVSIETLIALAFAQTMFAGTLRLLPPDAPSGSSSPSKDTTMGTNRLPWILTGLFLTAVSVGNAQTPPPPSATEGILAVRCREFVFPPPTRGEALSPAACRTGALPPLTSNDCQLIDPAYCVWHGLGLARSRSSTPLSAVPAPVGPLRNTRSSGSEHESALRASRKVGGV